MANQLIFYKRGEGTKDAQAQINMNRDIGSREKTLNYQKTKDNKTYRDIPFDTSKEDPSLLEIKNQIENRTLNSQLVGGS